MNTSLGQRRYIACSLAAAMCMFTSFLSIADEVDKLITTTMQKRFIPGLQLAVVKDKKIVKAKGYGIANQQDDIAVKNHTVFSINSMTKAFTGVALMQLVEKGVLTLDDGIGKHLPELPKAWHNIKIKHLMAHTSGLPKILSGYYIDLIVRGNPKAAWEKVQTLPMVSKTNTRFDYNQTGYVIVGKIIDKYVDGNFIKFITDNQLKPVGMQLTASAGFEYMTSVIKNQARQYLYDKEEKRFINIYGRFSYMLRTSAGMNSTATELAQYMIALQSKTLINDLDALWSPVTLNNGKTQGFSNLENGYAIGWQVIDRGSHPAVSASGGNAVTMIHYPNDGVSIVVLTNLVGALPIQFVDEIAAHYIEDFAL
ncbi:serine hydrolase domain-containing protein [Pseudoalteromonas sp. Of7M-16]|uniref:serine hydrolase domain-containing protein n=1 Tax=Pseudoalteromonas sp. Of7M-16 TaxID=2917756 RepID=UPI001EF4BC10|nr:serine hydrolase domain-containing protein [Pseudoalteromonas sp. Of7M-16]MCG7550510.1 beta-lactamase family protein [Pseudoalteromonas sp. Of7M-16]